jgi:inner membrane protein
MLIAHVPAGYLLGAAAQRMAGANGRSIMLAALLGSMTPDFDMLYFHLIDGRQTHHHHYFTHWPVFWLTLALALTFVSVLLRRPRLIVVLAFSAGTLLHMVLDTIAAPILRLMPFDNRSFEMVEIPQSIQTGYGALCFTSNSKCACLRDSQIGQSLIQAVDGRSGQAFDGFETGVRRLSRQAEGRGCDLFDG